MLYENGYGVTASHHRLSTIRSKVLRYVKEFMQYLDDFIKVVCLFLRSLIDEGVEMNQITWTRKT